MKIVRIENHNEPFQEGNVSVSDDLHSFIRNALVNAAPGDFDEFESNTDGTLFTVDGFTIDLR